MFNDNNNEYDFMCIYGHLIVHQPIIIEQKSDSIIFCFQSEVLLETDLFPVRLCYATLCSVLHFVLCCDLSDNGSGHKEKLLC